MVKVGFQMQLCKGSRISKVDKFLLNVEKMDRNHDVSYARSPQSKTDLDNFYHILKYNL